MKSPWYPRFPQDFIGSIDCRMMTLEQYGLYNWLLDYAWNNESMPCYLEHDTLRLAKLVGIPLKKFLAVYAPIQKKFKLWIDPRDQKEYIYNPRLLEEYHKRLAQSEKQAEKGRKSGAARRTNLEPETNHGSATVQPQHEPELNPTQSQSQENTNTAKRVSRYTQEFEVFWLSSSQRGSKWEAFALWQRLSVDEKALASAAMGRAMELEWKGLESRLIPHVVRWLRGKRWEVTPFEKPKTHAHTAGYNPTGVVL